MIQLVVLFSDLSKITRFEKRKSSVVIRNRYIFAVFHIGNKMSEYRPYWWVLLIITNRQRSVDGWGNVPHVFNSVIHKKYISIIELLLWLDLRHTPAIYIIHKPVWTKYFVKAYVSIIWHFWIHFSCRTGNVPYINHSSQNIPLKRRILPSCVLL